ncbi:lysine--tRNA ligase [Paracraurococcus ruber]|uniref:Lysine--tRNA ligase n=1 Tax=Paracraurococcus ruber TaxID=77675 RepID=A0ABS1CUG3_9PROT|nr:lysine--tRNA ligase [Paracraurococcus ruber]MBK1657632.1 lysine--tRNA ligase [Paracraurococcus ruber]TDG34209.1 lysine--tRNA ligase [Paracraurococcus ruber]
MTADPSLRSVKAWPFEEAAKVADRLDAAPKPAEGDRAALFETGYGPSGLPHIGTFGEVARTTWVMRAYQRLTGRPARLIAFSDDMDGLRKVPDNVPEKEMLAKHLGRPLTAIPDPFGTHPSFGAHNNARLQAFLDAFGFEYEFASSTHYYRSGRFDAALLRMAERHEAVRNVILPTLGPERRATYSPFLPIHPETGVVMQVPMEEVRPQDDLLVWIDPDTGTRQGTRITGGGCKAQWKADWALRWYALGVDYEMSGKDLIDSVRLSGAICRILGGTPPVGFTYELFLDEHGQKISKSKGNGLTIEEWLRYAPNESLGQFMYQAPQRAKRLYFDSIPRAVDEYLANLEKLKAQPDPANPAFHIHNGGSNDPGSPISFAMLLNLASVVNADDAAILWGFIRRYAPGVTPDSHPMLARLADCAVAYYRDFVAPEKVHRLPSATERAALEDLLQVLRALPADSDAEAIQNLLYEVGKRHDFANLRDWFGCLYQVLLGQKEGPRFGGFVALYGIAGTIGLIETALARRADAA